MIFFVLLLITLTNADPTATGGANCTSNFDCGGLNAGYCLNNKCDCSYQRYSAALVGGLNIGLPFVGIGGVGNFIIGRTGPACGQLILMLSYYLVIIASCYLGCAAGFGKLKSAIPVVSVITCAISMAILAGFIWSIIDGAFMLEGKIVDSNGYSLS